MRSGLIGKNGKTRARGKNRTRGSYNRAEGGHFDKKLKLSGSRMSKNHPSKLIHVDSTAEENKHRDNRRTDKRCTHKAFFICIYTIDSAHYRTGMHNAFLSV